MRKVFVVVFLVSIPFRFGIAKSDHQGETEIKALDSQRTAKRVESVQGCPGYNPQDPFAMNLRYPSGPRKGECLRLDEFRPIHILSVKEAQLFAEKAGLPEPQSEEVWIANLRHQDKFWVARIPKDSVADVLFEIERFDYGGKILAGLNQRRWYAAHAEVRFKFKNGKEVTLIPQFKNDHSSTQQIQDLVVSSEAVRKKGEPFNPLKGNRGHYGLAKRVLSLDQVINDSVVKLGHEIAQYPVQIAGNEAQKNAQRQNYLTSALTRSNKDWESYHSGAPVLYDTKHKNCISDALDIFDDVTRYPHFTEAQKSQIEVFPKFLLSDLYERSLIPSTKRYQHPTLNQETGIPFRQK